MRSLAATCSFGDAILESIMRDVFVIGINHPVILDRLFEIDASSADATFSKVVNVANAEESAIREHSNRAAVSQTEQRQ